MKEDILEQIAEDYFSSQPGFFIKTNVKYRPESDNKYGYIPKTDSVNSDIDLVAIYGPDINKIYVVNCKSWQNGLNVDKFIKEITKTIKDKKDKVIGEREFWAHFRELCIRKWTDAFIRKLRVESGNSEELSIIYTILCTKTTKIIDLTTDPEIKKLNKILREYFKKIDKKIIFEFSITTIDYYVDHVIKRIDDKITPAVENTHLARTFQLLIASDHKIIKKSKLKVDCIGKGTCTFCKKQVTDNDEPYICYDDYIETRFCCCKECKNEKNDMPIRCEICGKHIKKIKKRPTIASSG